MVVMGKFRDLTLKCMAIGSLPHKDVENAMQLVDETFEIPFWPQLARLNKNEDMIAQFLEGLPGLVNDGEKIYLDNESDEFFESLEEFFMDYEEIIENPESEALNKYGISENNSLTFAPFLKLVEKKSPTFTKGQIVGPFTLATTLCDKDGRCAFYDETLREIIVKLLTLKAIWQIKQFKKACPKTTPIVFIDEPSISQLGTSAFITISKEEVVEVIKNISDVIKANGALSAIHCCGKCDWTVPIECGVSIINLDGYFFAQNLSLFSEELKPFLSSGGVIAWGVVPTLDKDALEKSDIDSMVLKFEEAISYLVKKGVDKDLILNQSMVTPSCGAGSLELNLAVKAMKLTNDLSLKLREKFNK